MSGVNASRVVLPIVAIDVARQRIVDTYGSSWLVRPGLLVTCRHCLPELPTGQVLAAARKNPRGSYDARELRNIQADPRGHDLATAFVDFDTEDQAWPLYPGVAEAGMQVWSYGYALPDFRVEGNGERTIQIYPRFLQGYVTRRFIGDPPTFPRAELDLSCPPGLSGAPIVYGGTDQVLGIVFGRTTVKVPDEDPAPLYHFGLAFDREILGGLLGPATEGRPLSELM